MEAMVEGIPCIVSNTRGLRDLIDDGENGFIINHSDNHQLVERFVELIQNKTLYNQMSVDTVEKVNPYLLENVLKEYSVIYSKLLKDGG